MLLKVTYFMIKNKNQEIKGKLGMTTVSLSVWLHYHFRDKSTMGPRGIQWVTMLLAVLGWILSLSVLCSQL